MPTRVTIPELDLDGLMGEFQGALEEARDATANDAPRIVTDRARRGREPGGGSLPELDADTTRRKGHARALERDGVLLDPDQWQVTPEGRRVLVDPPPSRQAAAVALDEAGFDMFADRDPDLEAAADANLQRAADAVDISQHIRSRGV